MRVYFILFIFTVFIATQGCDAQKAGSSNMAQGDSSTDKRVINDQKVESSAGNEVQQRYSEESELSCEIDSSLFVGEWTIYAPSLTHFELGDKITIRTSDSESFQLASNLSELDIQGLEGSCWQGQQSLKGTFEVDGCTHIIQIDPSTFVPFFMPSCDSFQAILENEEIEHTPKDRQNFEACLKIRDEKYTRDISISWGHDEGGDRCTAHTESSEHVDTSILHYGTAHGGGTE